ncbi:hypothetical protein CEE45_04210 [Candidatus Heimdallarchaeota archaeon B3_Heim]|nr:MAG: hypothetical protein CEE45_04210 [Candidatus Heimdallarchaeota archaeon B3_Heim]
MKFNFLSVRYVLVMFSVLSVLLSSTTPIVFSLPEFNTGVNIYTDWNSMITSRKTAIDILPAYADYPDHATNWTDYTKKSIDDLLTFDECWINLSGGNIGFRPYVKGADGWGGEDWTRESAELIATVDVIWPLYRYLQLQPNSTQQSLVEEFINSLPLYYSIIYEQATNGPGETNHDSWYYLENSVLKWGQIFMMSQASVLNESFYGSLGSAIEMAHNFNYLFPQFVSVETKQQTRNTNINYGTSGLLAYSLIDVYELTGNIEYLNEAKTALEAMRAVKEPYKLMYEPQEIAAGVAAASRLLQYVDVIESSTDFAQLAIDLFYAEEQVLYYNNGEIDWSFGFNPEPSPWLPSNWRDGLHSPYANPKEVNTGGINAPAYKENIESIMFWTSYLKNLYFRPGFKAIEPLKILNLNRIKNFYFFSPSIPDVYERDYGPTTLQYIPYEDIDYHTSRGFYDPDPLKAGYNGKEIYGAGETLWNFLMFEALGEATDNKSLIVNLNIFDQSYLPEPENRIFMIFNPYEQQKSLEFTLKHLTDQYDIYVNGTFSGQYQPGESFNTVLPPLGSAYITLSEISTEWILPIVNVTTIPAGNNSFKELPILLFLGISGLSLIAVLTYTMLPKRK